MNCTTCYIEDSTEHYFYQCLEMFKFWREFGRWFNDVFNCTVKLGCLNILFGVINQTIDDVLYFQITVYYLQNNLFTHPKFRRKLAKLNILYQN